MKIFSALLVDLKGLFTSRYPTLPVTLEGSYSVGCENSDAKNTHPSHASLKDAGCSIEQLRVSCELLPSVL